MNKITSYRPGETGRYPSAARPKNLSQGILRLSTIGFLRLAILACISLILLWAGVSPVSEAKAAPILQPVAMNAQLAREASTFRQDVALTNRCVEAGVGKTECLCVTRVLKYELSLREYEAASQLYALPEGSAERRARKRDLVQRGYSASEVAGVDALTKTLVSDSDFGLRCSEAASWFETAANRPTH